MDNQMVLDKKIPINSEKRRAAENKKIKCGQAHFDELGVDFKSRLQLLKLFHSDKQSDKINKCHKSLPHFLVPYDDFV